MADIRLLTEYHKAIAEIEAVKVEKQPMTIEELILAAQTKSLTPEALERFAERVRAREAQFESEHSPITEEFLNRNYTV